MKTQELCLVKLGVKCECRITLKTLLEEVQIVHIEQNCFLLVP